VVVLYGAAHALMTWSIVAGVMAMLWLFFRAYHNYSISTNKVYASRHRRARLLVSAPSLLLVVALLVGASSWLIGQTRISRTTVGAIVDQGRTLNEAGLRTEAEVFRTTVSTMVYYKLPGDSPVISWLNQAAKDLLYEKEDADIQVAEYGYINFETARSAPATIDPDSRTITVDLPTPTVRTYIYSVGEVRFSEGPLNAIGTAMKAMFAAILHKPIVSMDISGELQTAQRSIVKRASQNEIFGCGKNEIEQQLAGIFGSLPQYRGWAVAVQFPGMRSIPESRCQVLQNRLVHTS
jgi:hypothetical protein